MPVFFAVTKRVYEEDAGKACGRYYRQQRQARFYANTPDKRATYPAWQGNIEYLHKSATPGAQDMHLSFDTRQNGE